MTTADDDWDDPDLELPEHTAAWWIGLAAGQPNRTDDEQP